LVLKATGDSGPLYGSGLLHGLVVAPGACSNR